jgi:hypothetical protein
MTKTFFIGQKIPAGYGLVKSFLMSSFGGVAKSHAFFNK